MKTKTHSLSSGFSASVAVRLLCVFSVIGLAGAGCSTVDDSGHPVSVNTVQGQSPVTTAIVKTKASAAAPAGTATIVITLNKPENFTDVKQSFTGTDKEREYVTEQIRDYMIERATPYLANGQTLAITINDIDLAGDFEPWHGPSAQDVRIIKDIYPPRISLVFSLKNANATVVVEGERNLTDLAFMMSASPINQSDPFRYEKALIDRWMSDEFGGLQKTTK